MTRVWEAHYLSVEGKWLIVERWSDDKGRQCTRFIAEVFEQAGDPAAAAVNAKMIVDAHNAGSSQAPLKGSIG